MSRTAKYSRISELFTEGSHHRNLSVMAIDICTLTKTRPWDEIVTIWSCLITLWTDSKSWLCFNRCIPRILNICSGILKKPYGYLLIDLKPTMTEDVLAPMKLNKTGREDKEVIKSGLLPLFRCQVKRQTEWFRLFNTSTRLCSDFI